MKHVSTGRFLDLRVPSERFLYYIGTIDWINPQQQTYIIDLIENYFTRYGNLNPYAMVMGFLAVVVENGQFSITDKSLKKALKLLDNSNFRGDKLIELIEPSDVIRYARLYMDMETKARDNVDAVRQDVDEEDYEVYDEEDDGEYGDDGYGEGDYDEYDEEGDGF